MKKKYYIQPCITIVVLEQSISLLSSSDSFQTNVDWENKIENDEEID